MSDTPGPQYKVVETGAFKKRSMSIKFESGKTGRLDPIKRTAENQTDFYNVGDASKATMMKSPINSFSKSPKKSFAEQAASRNKMPGVGSYKVTERSFKMLSPSPNARRR